MSFFSPPYVELQNSTPRLIKELSAQKSQVVIISESSLDAVECAL